MLLLFPIIEIKKHLEKNKIETKIYHEPLIPYSAYKHIKKYDI